MTPRCYLEGPLLAVEGGGKAIEKAPEVNTSAAEDIGEATPMKTDGAEPQQSGPQPDTIPETNAAPGSGEQPPSKEGEEYQLHHRPPLLWRRRTL